MQTYTARLVAERTKPLHPLYVQAAKEHAERYQRNGGATRPSYETTCPYCGDCGPHVGKVRVGAKHHVNNVAMTRDGYERPKEREVDLLLIECVACNAAIDPLAYLSPLSFFFQKTQVSLLPEAEE